MSPPGQSSARGTGSCDGVPGCGACHRLDSHTPRKGSVRGRLRDEPELRQRFRWITVLWGISFISEFALKVILVYTLPVATVLTLGPIASYGIMFATLGLTFALARRPL